MELDAREVASQEGTGVGPAQRWLGSEVAELDGLARRQKAPGGCAGMACKG